MDKHISHGKIIRFAVCLITAMVFMAVAVFVMDRSGGFLPEWITWEEREIDAGDGITVILHKREVRISKNDVPVHKINKTVKVQDMLITDLDRDDDPELVLLCWRRGKYGPAQPFWENENP